MQRMRGQSIGPQQIPRVIRMPQAKAVVNIKCLYCCDGLHTPPSKISAALEILITVSMPIGAVIHRRLIGQSFLRRSIQFGIPVLDKD
nr:hypothetical protein RSP673_20490 [Ralstonia solanacearum P673]